VCVTKKRKGPKEKAKRTTRCFFARGIIIYTILQFKKKTFIFIFYFSVFLRLSLRPQELAMMACTNTTLLTSPRIRQPGYVVVVSMLTFIVGISWKIGHHDPTSPFLLACLRLVVPQAVKSTKTRHIARSFTHINDTYNHAQSYISTGDFFSH